MTPTVNLVGYYGMSNFGDELFVATALARAADLWPGATTRTFVPARPRRYQAMGPAGSATRLAHAAAAAAWAGTFAFCGGSVLQQLSGTTRLRAAIPGRRLEALGVSVGPFPTARDERQVMALLPRFDRLVVRDRASARRAPGSTLGGDLAALTPAGWFPAAGTRNRLVICPSAAAGARDADTFAREAAAAALLVADQVDDITILSLNTHPTLGDRALSGRIAARIGRHHPGRVRLEKFSTLGVRGTLALLASSRAVWSARLHAGVVAYLAGVPFLLAGHHEKCGELAADIGLDRQRLLPPDGTGMAVQAPGTLTGDPGVVMGPGEYRARAHRAYLGQGR